MALLTSSEAARALCVGVSSIKRWTDEGELEAVRTTGGHRRYTPEALLRFAAARGLTMPRLPADVEIPPRASVTLFEALRTGDAAAVRRLVAPRHETIAKRAAFLDRVVGDALREIGERWVQGTLTTDQEHCASHIITEEIDALRPPPTGSQATVMLSCPPDELHELPLHLVRLILEWSGWRTQLLGASLPWEAARTAVMREQPLIFASSSRTADAYRDIRFQRFVEFCNQRQVRVIVGGEWARGGTGESKGYLRFRTLRGFERWLRSEADYFARARAFWRGHVRQPARQDGPGLQDSSRRS